MIEPSALSLSKLLSDLTDRHVSFTLEPNALPKKVPTLLAIYAEVSNDAPIVARVDRTAIAVLGGALLGFPEDTAIERSGQVPKDAPIWDAMNEIFNISSTALSTQGRVVLKSVAADISAIPLPVQGVFLKPKSISTYRVAVDGKQQGLFTLFS